MGLIASPCPKISNPRVPLVHAFRELFASAPEPEPFLRDRPPELIARPVSAGSIPVVAALRGLARLAAPLTQGSIEGIEALACELDWRQTYSGADFGERFLETYAMRVSLAGTRRKRQLRT
jgi:hypothetical protein